MATVNDTKHEKAKKELTAILAAESRDMADVQGLLKELFKGTIETMLEGELDEHLGYEKHSAHGNNSGNSRNGYGQKTIKTELGMRASAYRETATASSSRR